MYLFYLQFFLIKVQKISLLNESHHYLETFKKQPTSNVKYVLVSSSHILPSSFDGLLIINSNILLMLIHIILFASSYLLLCMKCLRQLRFSLYWTIIHQNSRIHLVWTQCTHLHKKFINQKKNFIFQLCWSNINKTTITF